LPRPPGFFQFANDDIYVSTRQAGVLFEAASEPKRIEWYEGGHDIQNNDTATNDRIEWLRGELGL